MDVGAGREQHADHLLVVVLDRPVQRRRAVGRGGVHVGAFAHQRPERRGIAAFGGSHDRGVGGVQRRSDDDCHERDANRA